MGILNMTPNSFSDGGKFNNTEKAYKRALEMIKKGAQIIDIGGESTGPGSIDVSEKEEIKRIIPVLKKLIEYREKTKKTFLISIDTYKPKVAEKTLNLGADMINDVTALRQGKTKMAKLIVKYKVPIILMYSKDKTPRTTRENIEYKDVIKTITEFLKDRIDFAIKNGIKKDQIIIDPGMGAFVSGIGKYSYEILNRLKEFKNLKLPILVGTSRKGFLGEKNPNKDVETPFMASASKTIETNLLALKNGASIIRVHDVKEMKNAISR